MYSLTDKRFLILVATVALLTLAQVAWWTYVFMDNVATIESLKLENKPALSEGERARVHDEAFHKRTMFLSESIFFIVLTCLGLLLLYRGFRAAQRNQAAQKNFIEIMSHESKTPLTALKLRLESLADSTHSADTKKEIGLALREIRRLSGIFDKALNLTRLDAHAFHFQTVHLSDLIQEVLSRLDPLMRSRSVAVHLNLDPEIAVTGDAFALQNTIQNVVENSILYNPRDAGKIAVTLERSGNRAHLSIEDDGPGISPEDRPHIFERFYRGAAGNGTPGTGLGLFIAKYVMDAHRGSIQLVPGRWGGAHWLIDLPGVPA